MAPQLKRASIFMALLVLLLGGFYSPASAQEGDHARRLSGTYSVTGTTVCINSSAGFNGLDPIVGSGISQYNDSWSVEGLITFHLNGTGTLQGRVVYVSYTDLAGTTGGSGSDEFSTPLTYTVAADGAISLDLYAVAGTALTGDHAGQTYTLSDVQIGGYVGEGDRVITASTQVPMVETHIYAGFSPIYRVCHRSRVLVKL